jgi:hypothetical protein
MPLQHSLPRLPLVLRGLVLTLALAVPRWGWAQALLENPQPASFQSGIGVVSGWVCNAGRVDIEFDGSFTLQAAYGTSREDTRGTCGDTNNGFGLLFNWSILGDGPHTVRALADGIEVARAALTVTTLGLGEFAAGLTGTVQVADFPQAGTTTPLQWQENQQNFVIANGTASGDGGNNSPTARLENPQPASFQSGISVVSGWACTANRVDVEFDGTTTLQAAYGTSREDTRSTCGDANNGFGLLFNWNLLGTGTHTVRALADGMEFARATFTVTTLGLGEFATGLNGGAQVANFPQSGVGVQVQWQESLQNFPLAGALPAGVDAGICTTVQAVATDSSGAQANALITNPCVFDRNTLLIQLQNLISGSSTRAAVAGADVRSQVGAAPFSACNTSLRFTQGGTNFSLAEFQWLDAAGNPVCLTLQPGATLDTLVRANTSSTLDFGRAFGVIYAGQQVASFPPEAVAQCVLSVSPTSLDFGTVPLGRSVDRDFTVTNTGQATLAGDAAINFANDYSIVSGASLNLGPGQHQTVVVRFSPTVSGPQPASISVNSNCGSALVSLSATGSGCCD